MSLVTEVKRRTKAANGDEAELPRKRVSPEQAKALTGFIKRKGQVIKDKQFHEKAEGMGINPHDAEESMYRLIADLPPLKKKAQQMLPAMMIRPTVQDRVSQIVAEMVRRKQIPPRQAEEVTKALMEQAEPEIRKQEEAAYRAQSGEQAMAPATIMGAATTAASLAAFPWLISRAPYLIGRKPKKPMTLRESFKMSFMPAWLPVTAAFESGGHLLSPMSDPRYKAGERGYWKSVGESFRGAQEGLAERGAESRARYGMLGIPLQMFHGVMNPLASLSYLGRSVGDTFRRPDIKQWAQEAAQKRREMLNP
jgi:hypothetical protein